MTKEEKMEVRNIITKIYSSNELDEPISIDYQEKVIEQVIKFIERRMEAKPEVAKIYNNEGLLILIPLFNQDFEKIAWHPIIPANTGVFFEGEKYIIFLPCRKEKPNKKYEFIY